MSVAILQDALADQACLYCTTTDWSFGPVFAGDAVEKAEAFLAWFRSGDAEKAARELGIRTIRPLGGDGKDPRDYVSNHLEQLYGIWRDLALTADGDLKGRVAA